MCDPEKEKIEKEKQKIRDYFGTAVISGMIGAMADLIEADEMPKDEEKEETDR